MKKFIGILGRKFKVCAAATVLLMALATSAMAYMVDLTITYYNTPSWVVSSSLGFQVFEAANDTWGTPVSTPVSVLGSGGTGDLNPGVTQYQVSISPASPSDVYLTMWGEIQCDPSKNPACVGENLFPYSVFNAWPPNAVFADGTAWEYGPEWISLGNLAAPGLNLSGDLEIINGVNSGDSSWIVGTWEVTSPTPIPSTVFLLGFGLVGLIGLKKKRYIR